MFHPTWVNIVSFFYPLGNTPAICLTQDLPREQKANILLLGCGDVRNILFTAYCDDEIKSRHLDITCCDHEPAILARNILVLTLIVDFADGSKDISIWNVYYHALLDRESLELLHVQSQKLSNISASIQDWHNGRYGKFVRICDQATLERIRRVWRSYGSPSMSEDEKKIHHTRLISGMQIAKERKVHSFSQSNNFTALRSAAPASTTLSAKELPGLFDHFWAQGSTDRDSDTLSKTKFPNPMFAGSLADNLTLHYGTDPLLGFHLATAFANLSPNSPLKLSEGHSLQKVAASARLQFQEWSKSFRKYANEKLTIRFFAGDAIAFCHALQHEQKTGGRSESNWYCDQNHMEPLILDSNEYSPNGNAPMSFHVIDTSNLLDHLGAINLLVAISPLLEQCMSATIYTDILVKNDEGLEKLVDGILCGHFSTISVLLGLIPVEYWTNSTAISTVNESLFGKLTNTNGQMHSRLTWKRQLGESIMAPLIKFDESDLANILYQFYLNMFKYENTEYLLSKASLQTAHQSSLLHYNRGSLASFLCFIKKRVAVEWNEVMLTFVSLVESSSTLILGMNYIQELCTYLHLLDVHSVSWLAASPSRPSQPCGLRGITAWRNIPAVICITLEVPRAKLQAITSVPLEELGTPILECTLQSSDRYPGQQWQNIFACVQLAFGKISTSGSRDDDAFSVSISEDTCTWNGQSALIVSFMAPTWIVFLEPDAATVAFGIAATPQSWNTFGKRLGLGLSIFKTKLKNEKNVYMTKYRPNHTAYPSVCNFESRSTFSNNLGGKDVSITVKANVDRNTAAIKSFVGRLDILSEKIQSSLRDGATIEVTQVNPRTIGVSIGKSSLMFKILFPTPIPQSRSKTRIARKSSYIEVILPMADPKEGNGFPRLLYPTFISKEGPVVWNMPRLDLGRLPIIDTSPKSELGWLRLHTTLMFSSRELRLREKSMASETPFGKDVRLDFKDSLFSMFMRFSGLQGERVRIFGIHNSEGGGVHILVVVSCLRLDLGNRTVILDAAVIPLRISLISKLQPFLEKLPEIGLCKINVNKDELLLWKEVLPTWVERCREWEHRPSCEYQANPQIPLSVEFGQNPICSCGEGIIPKENLKIPKWELAAKHAVRAAISPSFSVEFVEPSVGVSEIVQSKDKPKPSRATDECKGCGKKESTGGKRLLICSRCQAAGYCSADCQRKDWKEHKKVCF